MSKYDALCGYKPDPRATEEFLASQGVRYFSCAPGSGRGKRALLWQYVLQLDSGAFSEVQTGPDCTSHGSRNSVDTARSAGILSGRRLADWRNRTATEPIYGARGDSDGGMSPARASRFLRDVGYLPRENHGIVDLSKYNFSIGDRWGARGVPEAVQKLCAPQKVGTITLIETMADLKDALFNGYGVHSGQQAAWQDRPSGMIHRRAAKPWNHDMHIAGYDDTKEFWPFCVYFIQNSWGDWNTPVSGWPSELPPPPPGMIVSTEDDAEVCVSSKDCWAFSDVEGYPPTTLPDSGCVGYLQKG